MKRLYLVTGARGHLGNTIIKELIKRKEKVRATDLSFEDDLSLKDIDCEKITADVTNIESLKPLFKTNKNESLIVIHCAGIVTIASNVKDYVYKINVLGTTNIANLVIENKAKMIHVSSVHAIPEKAKGIVIKEVNSFDSNEVVGLYAKTKAAATKIILDKCEHEGLNAVVVHPSGIIGPNDFGKGHLTQLVIDFLEGKLTAGVVGGYDFVDVRDVASGIINASLKGRNKECYILSNKFYSVKELLTCLSKISNRKLIRVYMPMWLAKVVAPLAELYYKILKQPPLYTKYSLFTLQSNSDFSHDKATKELNYKPRDLLRTLNDTISFLKKYKRIKDN